MLIVLSCLSRLSFVAGFFSFTSELTAECLFYLAWISVSVWITCNNNETRFVGIRRHEKILCSLSDFVAWKTTRYVLSQTSTEWTHSPSQALLCVLFAERTPPPWTARRCGLIMAGNMERGERLRVLNTTNRTKKTTSKLTASPFFFLQKSRSRNIWMTCGKFQVSKAKWGVRRNWLCESSGS